MVTAVDRTQSEAHRDGLQIARKRLFVTSETTCNA